MKHRHLREAWELINRELETEPLAPWSLKHRPSPVVAEEQIKLRKARNNWQTLQRYYRLNPTPKRLSRYRRQDGSLRRSPLSKASLKRLVRVRQRALRRFKGFSRSTASEPPKT